MAACSPWTEASNTVCEECEKKGKMKWICHDCQLVWHARCLSEIFSAEDEPFHCGECYKDWKGQNVESRPLVNTRAKPNRNQAKSVQISAIDDDSKLDDEDLSRFLYKGLFYGK
jgi:hypothetical protein